MTATQHRPTAVLPRPKAVLFDWDGTLANTIPVIQAGINHILERYKQPPAPFGSAVLASVTGSHGIFKLLLGDEEGVRAKAQFEEYMDGLYAANGGPLNDDLARDGSLEALKHCQAAGIKAGIVTNKLRNRFQMECDALGFGQYLTTIVTLDDVVNRKPHPEMTQLACARLGLAAGPDVWVVGDHRVDSETAKQAGASAIFLAHGFDISDTHPPDVIIADLHALIPLIENAT